VADRVDRVNVYQDAKIIIEIGERVEQISWFFNFQYDGHAILDFSYRPDLMIIVCLMGIIYHVRHARPTGFTSIKLFLFSASQLSRALMWLTMSSHLSVHTCEMWQNGSLDQDAVWGGCVGSSLVWVHWRWGKVVESSCYSALNFEYIWEYSYWVYLSWVYWN